MEKDIQHHYGASKRNIVGVSTSKKESALCEQLKAIKQCLIEGLIEVSDTLRALDELLEELEEKALDKDFVESANEQE